MLLRRRRASRSPDRVSANPLHAALVRAVVIIALLATLFGLGLAVRLAAALAVASNTPASHLPVVLLPFIALPIFLAR